MEFQVTDRWGHYKREPTHAEIAAYETRKQGRASLDLPGGLMLLPVRELVIGIPAADNDDDDGSEHAQYCRIGSKLWR